MFSLLTAVDEALRPKSAPTIVGAKSVTVDVPHTDKLLQSVLSVEQAIRTNNPEREAKLLQQHLIKGRANIQSIVGRSYMW